MLIRLDTFIHGRIMNPFFGFMQKWLHINRYRIILLTLAWIVVSWMGMIVSQIDHWLTKWWSGKWSVAMDWPTPFIALFFTVLFWDAYLRSGLLVLWTKALREASSRVEAGKASLPAPFLIQMATHTRIARPQMNVTFIVVTILDLSLMLLRPEVLVPPSMWLSSWSLILANLVMMHAQNAKDVDPRDRVTFRRSVLAKQKI